MHFGHLKFSTARVEVELLAFYLLLAEHGRTLDRFTCARWKYRILKATFDVMLGRI